MMKLEHIKNLLQISCTFNTSSISHSFSIKKEDILTVKCIKDTYILEITSNFGYQVEYYTSIDEAAEAISKKIHTDKSI